MNRPVFVRCAFLLLWLYVFFLPNEKAVEVPGLGLIGRAMGLIAIGGCLLAVALRVKIRTLTSFHVLLFAFMLWAGLSVIWTIEQDLTTERITTNGLLLVTVWMIWELCDEERQILSLMDAYIAGTILTAASVVEHFLRGKQTYYQRYATEGFDPNDLALTLALSIPISYFLSLTRRGWVRWLYRIHIASMLGAVLLTASRGGLVASVIAVSLILWTAPLLNGKQKAFLSAAAILTAVAGIFLVPAASLERLATLGSEVRAGTLNGRTVLWQAGWNAFSHTPFVGVGAGAYSETIAPILGRPFGTLPVAHDTYLSVLVEGGLIGFALFAAILTTLARNVSHMPWLPRRLWYTLLATWGTGALTLTWENRKPTWFFFGLLAAHSGVFTALRRRAAAPRVIAGGPHEEFTRIWAAGGAR